MRMERPYITPKRTPTERGNIKINVELVKQESEKQAKRLVEISRNSFDPYLTIDGGSEGVNGNPTKTLNPVSYFGNPENRKNFTNLLFWPLSLICFICLIITAFVFYLVVLFNPSFP